MIVSIQSDTRQWRVTGGYSDRRAGGAPLQRSSSIRRSDTSDTGGQAEKRHEIRHLCLLVAMLCVKGYEGDLGFESV